MTQDQLLADLSRELGDSRVIVDPERLPQYETDWLGRRSGRARCVVFPATHEQVVESIAICRHHHAPLIPQGGNTGLVGGGVPHSEEVVLSLRNLRSTCDVHTDELSVVADAGLTIGEVGEQLASQGLELPFDLASRDSATVGGVVATNAGGLRVIRFGHVRRQLMGIRAVLPDGTTIDHLEGLRKDTAGYDLTSLLCGSEGTLGIITAARFAAVVPDPASLTACVGCDSLYKVMDIIARARQEQGAVLGAAELMREEGVAQACDLFGTKRPFREHSAYLLLLVFAAEDGEHALAACEAVLSSVAPDAPVAIASDHDAVASLWALRERHPEIVGRLGTPLKLDTAVPLSVYATAMEGMEERIHMVDPGAKIVLYGHAGDGSMHVNVAPSSGAFEYSIQKEVYEWISSCKGTISAEHGIGWDKREWLHLIRSREEIALYRRMKAAIDPGGLLNPGVLFPSDAGSG